jgi:hypothetical protein
LEFKKIESQFSNLVTWGVFLITIVFVIITLTSAIFPNLLLTSFGGVENHANINPFETGMWTYPLLVTNFMIFGLAILYWKKRLPSQLTSSIQFIFNFEVSAKIAFFVITILIGLYIIFSVGELFDGQFQDDYNERVNDWLENFSLTEFETKGLNAPTWGSYLHILFGVISIDVFDNVKVIPFLASISLLVLTYFITFEITQKRFAGIIAFVILLQSVVFLHYDTGIVYPTFWILFYLFSLYLMYKKWPASPVSYVISILTKMMTLLFLPMTLFFIYRASISKQNKIRLMILYGIVVVLGVLFLILTNSGLFSADREFESHDFWGGFNAIHQSLRFDPLVILFMLPLIVGLFFTSRRGFRQADSITFLILGMLLSALLIPSLTGTGINAPYRFIPLVLFFAMGVGVLLSKKVTE